MSKSCEIFKKIAEEIMFGDSLRQSFDSNKFDISLRDEDGLIIFKLDKSNPIIKNDCKILRIEIDIEIESYSSFFPVDVTPDQVLYKVTPFFRILFLVDGSRENFVLKTRGDAKAIRVIKNKKLEAVNLIKYCANKIISELVKLTNEIGGIESLPI